MKKRSQKVLVLEGRNDLAMVLGSILAVFCFWHVGASFGFAQQLESQGTVLESQGTVSTAVYTAPAVAESTNFSWVQPANFALVPTPDVVSVGRDWALETANAKLGLQPNGFPNLQNAKMELEKSMVSLENFLATSPQHQANWFAFLNWNELKAQLAQEKPERQKLAQIEKTFRQNYLGLEFPQFANVRESLKRYLVALRFSADQARSIEFLGQELAKVSEKLQVPDFQKDFEATREIGETLTNLSQSNQAMELVRVIRSHYSRANLRVLVSNQFVNEKFAKPVNESNPVNELILGTQIYGQSQMTGFVIPQLVDSSSNAMIRLNLSSNFSSQNIGYNRSVKLHTQGYGSIAASETIALMDSGLVPLNDTRVDANLASQIDNIEAKLGIVRKIASKQAAKSKPEADAIAEARLENRVKNQFHSQISTQIAQANEKIRTPEMPILKRLGLDRPHRMTWSSPNYLALLWTVQQGAQLSAPTSCPLVVEGSGISVQFHESVISNLTDPVLGGRILRSAEFPALAAQFEGLNDGKPILKDDGEVWSLTMDKFNPVELQLDNGLITFRIRTEQLDKGDQVLDQPAAIEASYLPVVTDGLLQFQRQGEIRIDFSAKSQKGLKAVTLRSFLKNRFDQVFKETLLEKPINVTEKLPEELQGLQLASIQVDDGWLQAHLR